MKKIFTLLALGFCVNAGAQCTPPSAPILTAPTSVNNASCQGLPPALTVNSGTNVAVWYSGNAWLYTGSSYTPPASLTPGTYTYSVIDSIPIVNGCINAPPSANTMTLSLVVNPVPLAPTTITNPVKDCKEVAITLSVTPSGGSIPVWYHGFNHNHLATGNTYAPYTGNSQTIVYSINDSSTTSGCISSPLSLTLTVEQLPEIIINTITIDSAHCGINNGGVTFTVSGIGAFGGKPPIHYQWYNGSGIMTNDTSLNLLNVASGTYSLHITDANGCNATTTGGMNDYSVPIVNCTGIEQISGGNSEIRIYPNPNKGSFVIEPNAATKQTVMVYDVNGKAVLSQTINGKTTIDASTLNEGVYNISMSSNEGVLNKRLVIVK